MSTVVNAYAPHFAIYSALRALPRISAAVYETCYTQADYPSHETERFATIGRIRALLEAYRFPTTTEDISDALDQLERLGLVERSEYSAPGCAELTGYTPIELARDLPRLTAFSAYPLERHRSQAAEASWDPCILILARSCETVHDQDHERIGAVLATSPQL